MFPVDLDRHAFALIEKEAERRIKALCVEVAEGRLEPHMLLLALRLVKNEAQDAVAHEMAKSASGMLKDEIAAFIGIRKPT